MSDPIHELEEMLAEERARINIHDFVDAICWRLGLEAKYVAELTIRPSYVTATIYQGQEGRFQGPKHIDPETGKAVTETLTFKVTA